MAELFDSLHVRLLVVGYLSFEATAIEGGVGFVDGSEVMIAGGGEGEFESGFALVVN